MSDKETTLLSRSGAAPTALATLCRAGHAAKAPDKAPLCDGISTCPTTAGPCVLQTSSFFNSLSCQVCASHRCTATSAAPVISCSPPLGPLASRQCTASHAALPHESSLQEPPFALIQSLWGSSCRGHRRRQQRHWRSRLWLRRPLPGLRASWRCPAGPGSGTLIQSRATAAASGQRPAFVRADSELFGLTQYSTEGHAQTPCRDSRHNDCTTIAMQQEVPCIPILRLPCQYL